MRSHKFIKNNKYKENFYRGLIKAGKIDRDCGCGIIGKMDQIGVYVGVIKIFGRV